jgi:hypothetical protein
MKNGSFFIAARIWYIGILKTVYTLPNSLGRGNHVGFLSGSSALFGSVLAIFLGGRFGADVTLVLARSSSTRTYCWIRDMRSLIFLVGLLERLCLNSDFESKPYLKAVMAISSVSPSTSLYTSQYLEE